MAEVDCELAASLEASVVAADRRDLSMLDLDAPLPLDGVSELA